MSSVRLFYFDFPGRGELVRLVLAVAGVEFDDVRFSGADWAARYKPEAPFGQVPYVEYKGKKYGQSVAIATFFAQENGLYGDNNLQALRIDEVVGLVQDFIRVFIRAFVQKDPAKKEELWAALVKDDAPRFFGFFQKLLQENGSGYFVGDKLSLADLTVYDIVKQTRDTFNYDASTSFPEIKTLVENIESNENIKTYINGNK
ncbi:hypothetical protein C0Q70_17399 [Pomacea canaliculata]|uniref:Glutathione transferase n=1 Tax=Pomacea canaliculata TaxID=400727 RepID=A0A2T7NKA0_POMCA|nr:probable glutathione S-transferase 7 [Pomacea canaliculata]PVD21600.1 hypothetical protein C0Q70_17399 [Pomacea canaliculata]